MSTRKAAVSFISINVSESISSPSTVSLPTLVKIANALGVSLDQLVCDSLPVSGIYLEKDFADLLADCTLEEKRMLKDIVIATKRTLRERTGG